MGLLFGPDLYKVVLAARIRGQYRGYHAHLVESGTKERSYIAKKTVHFRRKDTTQWFSIKAGDKVVTGRTKPTRFLWLSVRMTEKNTSKILGDEFFKSLDRYHRKNGIK